MIGRVYNEKEAKGGTTKTQGTQRFTKKNVHPLCIDVTRTVTSYHVNPSTVKPLNVKRFLHNYQFIKLLRLQIFLRQLLQLLR